MTIDITLCNLKKVYHIKFFFYVFHVLLYKYIYIYLDGAE